MVKLQLRHRMLGVLAPFLQRSAGCVGTRGGLLQLRRVGWSQDVVGLAVAAAPAVPQLSGAAGPAARASTAAGRAQQVGPARGLHWRQP